MPTRAVPPDRPAADGEQRHRAGLLLWTSLHRVVSLRIDEPCTPWPPVQDVLADLLVLHTGAAQQDITAILADRSRSRGPG